MTSVNSSTLHCIISVSVMYPLAKVLEVEDRTMGTSLSFDSLKTGSANNPASASSFGLSSELCGEGSSFLSTSWSAIAPGVLQSVKCGCTCAMLLQSGFKCLVAASFGAARLACKLGAISKLDLHESSLSPVCRRFHLRRGLSPYWRAETPKPEPSKMKSAIPISKSLKRLSTDPDEKKELLEFSVADGLKSALPLAYDMLLGRSS
mmetsp:Transcript_52493/g.132679  ORF Transcript_52493/g.132679 Transcript_52493/m.132679 type:complete len:206 (-) Transcript_52493:79-696(-)